MDFPDARQRGLFVIRRSSVNLWPMNLVTIEAPDFDLAKTLDSGQTFHWEPLHAGFAGMISKTPSYLEQDADQLRVLAGTAETVRHYFALDHPLREICARFPDDAAMCAARDYCRG